ncbi:Hypothetical predicted protein [Octopus vulgaris]|uniref:Uncharacterized protein n=1 Tax=Octopus vulgaris TaxID=6645 RepID=A0AA36AV29_OCTVU|nr:Hypothetical predicted protein [Octopus vulgaris]
MHATENDINIRHKGNEESDEQYSPPRGLIERLPSDQSTQRPEDTRNSIVPVKDSQENEKTTVTEDLAFAEEHRESMAEMRQKILNTLEVVRHTNDHYMQIPRFDCKSIMKSHPSKFRPLCPAVSKILQLTDSDNDSKNLVTVSRIVEIRNGIVTYSPDLKLISCATTGGDFDFHCSSNVTDMTRIGEHTVLATIPFRKKIVFINPSSFHIKSLDYSFFTISYFEHSTFVGTEMFSKTIYLIDWDKNKFEEKFSVKEIVGNIAVGPQYHILIALDNINRISCYTIDGRHLFQLRTHSIDIPTDLTVYRNYSYAVQGNVIYKISANGAVSQREIGIKARYICVATNNIYLTDRFGLAHIIRTNKDFWPRLSYHHQDHVPSLINQIHIDDPSNITTILPMSASSVVIIYRDLKAILVTDEGQPFGGKCLTFKLQPSVFCRVDSNTFLVLFSEDRKLQYITCPQLTEGDLIDVESNYIQMCHMVSNRSLALTTNEGKVEVHILLIKTDHVDIVNRISLEHDNVAIAATPINFVVVDRKKLNLLFYSSFGEELSKKHIEFNGYPHHVFTDKLYLYVIFRRESLMTCYNIIGQRKWQLKLPSNFRCHAAVFQGTAYVLDDLLSQILLYKYHDWSDCHVTFQNPYNKNLNIRLEEKENDQVLIGEICHLANGQLVLSDIYNDCLLYISNEGNIVSRLSLPSTATDICRWNYNQIGVTLPLEKQLRVFGNVSKAVISVSLNQPYVRVCKLGESHIICYCDKPSHLDILNINNCNQVQIIHRINIPFVMKSLSLENETLKLLIVGKKAVFFYKIIRRRSSVLPSQVKTPSNLYGDGGPYSIEMIPNILLSQGKTQSNLYGGRIDKMCVHLIDNSRMFAVNEHDLLVKDHVTRSQINMFIDLVDVFSRNISLSEMLSSRLYLQDLTVSDKAHEVVVLQSFGDKHPVEIGCLVITENNLVALYDSTNQNIKILTFDVKDIDISDEGKTVVCEMANNGNVKLFDEDGKLLCYRDFGSFVGGVCFTGERNILVTLPNRQEIFQLKSQNLEKYKVWESQVPYGIIWRKVGNIYWCVHINMIECDTIKIDGDQLKVLESVPLSNLDFGLHFPSITSQKKGMFSNELFNKLKNGGDGGERSTSRKIEVRRGNYIAEIYKSLILFQRVTERICSRYFVLVISMKSSRSKCSVATQNLTSSSNEKPSEEASIKRIGGLLSC